MKMVNIDLKNSLQGFRILYNDHQQKESRTIVKIQVDVIGTHTDASSQLMRVHINI